jgi:hypothetical protein
VRCCVLSRQHVPMSHGFSVLLRLFAPTSRSTECGTGASVSASVFMRKYLLHLRFGAGCGIGSEWLVGTLGVSSAFSDFVGLINIVPYFLSAILCGSDFGDAREG